MSRPRWTSSVPAAARFSVSRTRASATWGSSGTRTAIRSSCTGGTRRVDRAQLLERYRALPLPTTSDEHWRFTDLKGFDPDSFGHVQVPGPGTRPGESMLEIDVAALATA